MLQTAVAAAALLQQLHLQLAALPTLSALLRVLLPAWHRWLLPLLPSLPANRRCQCVLTSPECGMRWPSPLAAGQQSLDASHIHTWHVHGHCNVALHLPLTSAPHMCAHVQTKICAHDG